MTKSVNRQQALRAFSLASPALSRQTYIPAYTHFLLADGWVSAYNDITAISVNEDLGLDLCLPGDLIVKTLNSFTGESVSIAEGQDAGIVVSHGRSKIKVPTLPAEDFPLKWPSLKSDQYLELDDAMIRAIQLCLPGCGTNPQIPAQMGVTIAPKGETQLAFYSTDNYTVTRCLVDSSADMPTDDGEAVVMPLAFCEQVLALAKAYPNEDLRLYAFPGSLVLKVGAKAKLMTRLLVELVPLDFESVIRANQPKTGKPAAIPPGWESALSRISLVVASEADKAFTCGGDDGGLRLFAQSSLGEVEEIVDFDGPEPEKDVLLDPGLVLRASKEAGVMQFGARALLFSKTDGKFIHLVAYSSR